ncbi:MAG: PqqD family protein [Planctomycetaceae bacterium]|nr:PqqD family protein [Planctomycetaceae bacterium]
MENSEMIFETLKTWRPLPGWRKKRDEGDMLLLSNQKLELHYLNSTAKDIVNLIDGRTIEEICSAMQTMYEVEKTILHKAVLNVIRELQWKHLIRVSK